MAEEVQQEELKEVTDGNNHHYEMAWAMAWCSALCESGFDGLKDASDCQIELPHGGVHTTQEQEEDEKSTTSTTTTTYFLLLMGRKMAASWHLCFRLLNISCSKNTHTHKHTNRHTHKIHKNLPKEYIVS